MCMFYVVGMLDDYDTLLNFMFLLSVLSLVPILS